MLGIFLDQETTGLDSKKHRVLELAFRVVDLARGKEEGAYCSIIAHPREVWEGRDPMSILVNGFTYEEQRMGKDTQVVQDEVLRIFEKLGIKRGKAVFICQNPSFDRPFFHQIVDPYIQERLFWPYHWLDLASMYWAFEMKKSAEEKKFTLDELQLSKDAIAASYGLPPERRPHRAENGVDHLLLCYSHIVGFPLK
jgi:oligoribonuclease